MNKHALLEFGCVMPGTIPAGTSPPLTCSIASSIQDLCVMAGLYKLLCWRLRSRTAAARCGRRLRRCQRRRRRRHRACPACLELGFHLPHGVHACH